MNDRTIRTLEPGDEGLLEAFLLPRLDASMFLLGNMRQAGLVYRGHALEGTYVAAFEGERIVGVAAHFWNQMVILQAPAHVQSLWRAAVAASGRPIGGLIGPAEQVRAAAAALDVDAANVQLDQTEKLYSLDLAALIVPQGLRTGRLRGRRAALGDLDRLARWRAAYMAEALHEEEGPDLEARARSAVEQSIREERTWIVEEDGRPVATSSFNARLREAVQVGGVWTPPALRRRGYGRAAVATSLLDARDEGAIKAILFTGEDNLPAQKAYEALGFDLSGDYCLWILRTPVE